MAQKLEKVELDQIEILSIIPEKEEIKEKVNVIINQKPRKKFFKKFSKSHEQQIDINKLKNKIDASIYRGGFYSFR
ncbi:hypothetical protein LCGC14_0564370 [marine sediment metagenome]|uniref:Uncharacterized protein n=1 Tax=marine sediment metagenome TaxID=412755 RepID=A0A0F9RR92_9ZZZZ|nr:MAG: hypothetical protein Lokiarch_37260 [Candidatus Lokiarchaeum sp. GC14_75]